MTSIIVPTIENTIHGLAVSSETVAATAQIEHRAVLHLVNKYEAKFEQFGRVAFEMRTFATAGGPQSARTALLNEPQAMLLITFLRNTEQVVAAKVALIQAFQTMKRIIETHGTQDSLFADDSLGLRIGKPVAELPPLPVIEKAAWTDPRTIRNNKIAEVAREAAGQWVPIFIDGHTPKQLQELALGIRYGKRLSFPLGEFEAAVRDETLYIQHKQVA